MPDTVQTLIDEVVQEGQFDATDVQALRWLNRRHRLMVAEARALRKRVSLGTTTAGVDFYPVSGVVELYAVTVGGVPFKRALRDDLNSEAQGTLTWTGPTGSGLLVADADTAGVNGFSLIPTPDTSGIVIEGFAAVLPDDLQATDPATALKVDSDFYDALVAGAIATGLGRMAQRPDLAASQEAIFGAGVDAFRRRVRRRLRGAGPSQIRILGVNA